MLSTIVIKGSYNGKLVIWYRYLLSKVPKPVRLTNNNPFHSITFIKENNYEYLLNK